MKINVHVRDKEILVQCGSGPQRLKWLGHVGIARYDTNNSGDLGVPLGVRNGTELFNMERIINQTLSDNDHVFIVLKGESIPDEVTKRFIPPPVEKKERPAREISPPSSSSEPKTSSPPSDISPPS